MPSKLRIAFIGSFSNASVNGVENAGYYLAQELVRQNVDVFFYYISFRSGCYQDENQIHHRFFAKARFSWWLPESFRRLLKNNPDQIDVFHLHSVFIPTHFCISLILEKRRIPYVVTPHGGYIHKALERTLQTHRYAKLIYIYLIERFIINHARAVIATTTLEANDITNFGCARPIYTIPNLTPPVVTNPEWTVPQNLRTILFFGRYDIAHKGLLFLLDTFKFLSDKLPDVQLIMHGEGKDKARMEKKVQEENIPRVTIGDPVYGTEKFRILQQCTLYCQPSQYEAFSLSIAEAMLAEKAVALTEGCYLSHLFTQQGLGLILPEDPQLAANKIQNFLSDPEELARQGKTLRALALEEFDSTRVGNKTIEIYHTVREENLSVAGLTSSIA